MIRLRSIHGKIFIRYALLIGFIIIFFLVSFTVYMSDILREDSTRTMNQLSSNISDTLNLELNNMYATAQKILLSASVKEAFFRYTSDPAVQYENNIKLDDIIFSINGPQPVFHRLNLYRNDGFRFEYGDQYLSYNDNLQKERKLSWIHEALEQGGQKYISPPHTMPDETSGSPVISLSMAFAEIYGMRPDNVIEVEQTYAFFQKIIERAVLAPDDDTRQNKYVYVYNENGDIIYPLQPDEDTVQLIQHYRDRGQATKWDNTIARNPITNERTILSMNKSDFSGWTVLLAEPESLLLQPVYTFTYNIIALGVLFLLLALSTSYFVANSLSTPIRRIKKMIKILELDKLDRQMPIGSLSKLDELEELHQTFSDMRNRLKDSLEKVISARSHELQSRLIALQSQMNPHFLYNSLSVLSIMCEEQRNDEAVNYCMGLSNMLRYVSSSSFHPVAFEEELRHVEDFIYLLKERYGEMLQIQLNTQDSLNGLRIPKLVIQPLIENCMKYALDADPPWKIRLVGKRLSNKWIVTVSDNGPGFSQDKLTLLKQRLQEIDAKMDRPELSIDGMGLVNIYMRLRMLYGDQLIFDLSNGLAGGACVTIGGPIQIAEVPE
ncbi:sensor histidine kinase [Paenibacillus sp. HB172176]|uniref:cache domain-containing sensor histidine kinase n=1 Tax=Paenibacillus sp. HB172176 TaxID=2493690 RepID=UPI0014389AF2|nr:sensor histidine kinase [Paenibacillus sp. HB172176]